MRIVPIMIITCLFSDHPQETIKDISSAILILDTINGSTISASHTWL